MKLRVRLGHIELEYDDPEEIDDALAYLGFEETDRGFLDLVLRDVAEKRYPMMTLEEGSITLRTAPEPGVGKPVVQCPSKTDDGKPLCEECAKPIAPLDEDAAKELFSRVICLSCGKELE